ncbi:MAG TPA: tetratricopeptide repeat-containing protein kinase family protein, partial [Kofleriaceae bacterium]
MIDRDGTPKVADFGLAQSLDDAGRSGIGGTPAFMSPEQWAGEQVGAASDQYSLAAVLAMALGARCPRWLRPRLARAKAERPEDRYRSIRAFAEAIDPGRRRRRAALVSAALAVIAIAVTVTEVVRRADPIADACAIANAPYFTPFEQLPAEQGLVAAGATPDAVKRFSTAAALYSTKHAAAAARVCEQYPASPQATRTFELAIACIADHRRQFTAAIARVQAVSHAELPMTIQWLHDLTTVEDCENPAVLAAEHAARSTGPALVVRVAGASLMRAALADERIGNNVVAEREARVALAMLRPFGGVVLAKSLVNYVLAATPVTTLPALASKIREAIALADAAHADQIRATAMVRLIEMYAHSAGHEQEALDNATLARSAIEAAGQDQGMGPVLDEALGIAQLGLGHNEEAREAFDRARARIAKVVAADDPRVLEYTYIVGLPLVRMGRYAEAASYFSNALAVAIQIFGPDAAAITVYEANLAIAHALARDCTSALREARHSLAILERSSAPDSVKTRMVLEVEGGCDVLA